MLTQTKKGRLIEIPDEDDPATFPDEDSPELDDEFFKNAIPFSQLPKDQQEVLAAIQRGEVEFTETTDEEYENQRKQRISIMLDAHIIKAYKAKAGGRGYQTLINETLRRGLEADSVKEALREVLREERQGHR